MDSNDQLFKLENGNLANYFGTLSMFLSELGQEYGDKVPGSYNVRISPENFLPSNLVPTRKKFKSQKKKVEPEVDIGEICRKTGYERSLIEGLANEGWDVHYLDAMLIKGLDLLTDDPFRGGNYLPKVLWLSNAKRALNTAGVSYEAKKFKNHMRKLKQLELLGEKKGKKCYSFNQKWYDVAQGALRDYLSSALSHGDD